MLDDCDEEGLPLTVVVEAARSRETGKSWCPDCVNVQGELDQILQGTKGPLLYATVTRQEWRGQAQHAYRSHPGLRVGGVPTVLQFRHG